SIVRTRCPPTTIWRRAPAPAAAGACAPSPHGQKKRPPPAAAVASRKRRRLNFMPRILSPRRHNHLLDRLNDAFRLIQMNLVAGAGGNDERRVRAEERQPGGGAIACAMVGIGDERIAGDHDDWQRAKRRWSAFGLLELAQKLLPPREQ